MSLQRDDLTLDGRELESLPGEVPLGAVEKALELLVAAGHACEREPGALPDVVVIDLSDRRTEAPLELRLQGEQLLALSLQRMVLGKVELERKDADVAGAHGA
jgi:hypothetical protein